MRVLPNDNFGGFVEDEIFCVCVCVCCVFDTFIFTFYRNILIIWPEGHKLNETNQYLNKPTIDELVFFKDFESILSEFKSNMAEIDVVCISTMPRFVHKKDCWRCCT